MTAARLTQTFERRTFLLGAVQGGVGLLLAGRLGYLAVAQNAKYSAASESNRVNLSLIPPRRGWVLDRNGKEVAPIMGSYGIGIERIAMLKYNIQDIRMFYENDIRFLKQFAGE